MQRICRSCKGEEEVKEILTETWESPENATSLLNKTAGRNRSIFDLEHKLAMPTTATCKIEVTRRPEQVPGPDSLHDRIGRP